MTPLPSLDRRRFLSSTSALAIGAALPGALSAREQDAKGEPVRIGVIGIGIRGRNLLRGSFLSNEGFRVVAVCDVDSNRRDDGKRLVDEHYEDADCAVFDDHRKLMARADIDAVVIATPDHWHANQILDACAAGKDVYCEKPLTLTLREGQIVIDAVRKEGVVFQTGSQQRSAYEHRFVTACELVRAGRIGRVLDVHVGVGDSPIPCDLPAEELEPGLDWDRWLGPAPARAYNAVLSPRGVHGHYPRWRDYREYAGGGLADMGAHHFDIAQWALRADEAGPVRFVPPQDPDARRGALAVYADGTRLTHGGPNGATFVGTDGLIHVDRGRLVSVPGKLLETPLEEGDERLPRNANHATNWLECIRARSHPICDVEVGARSAAVCQLFNLAYIHGRELTWNPAEWRFEGDDGANAWLDYERRAAYALPVV